MLTMGSNGPLVSIPLSLSAAVAGPDHFQHNDEDRQLVSSGGYFAVAHCYMRSVQVRKIGNNIKWWKQEVTGRKAMAERLY